MLAVLLGIVAVVIIVVLWGVGIYNALIQLRMSVKEAAADIETLLKKRFDMVPNLVSTVKGYAKHEDGVLTKVTELRAKMGNASGDMKQLSEVNNELTGTLKTLFAVAESYPDLKANASFLQLQQQLSDLETEVQKSRRYYNATVTEFNTKIQVFPDALVASMLKFTPEAFFSASEEEQQNVKVEF